MKQSCRQKAGANEDENPPLSPFAKGGRKGDFHVKNKSLTKSDIIALIIGLPQLIIGLLPWLGVKPSDKPKDIVGRIFSMLFLKISMIWVLFLSTVIIFTYLHFLTKRRNKDIVQDGTLDDKIKIKVKLTEEHYWILNYIANNQDNKSNLTHILEEEYKKKFQKATADFKVLRQELLDIGLIDELSLVYSSDGNGLDVNVGLYWEITQRGLYSLKNK